MEEKINNISSESVKKATGKTWKEWILLLDKSGAQSLTHKEIAKLLKDKKYIKNGWWCQMVTVGYEYAKGRRLLGKTEDVGYELGVQKMFPVNRDKLWDLILSPAGLKIWLGKNLKIKLEKGYKTNTGATSIEVRTFVPNEKLRLKYNKSTLQVSLFCPRNTEAKTNLRFHQENLKNSSERHEMKKHWQKVLTEIEKEVL